MFFIKNMSYVHSLRIYLCVTLALLRWFLKTGSFANALIIVFHQEVVLIEKRNIELHKLHFTVYRQCCAADIELMSGRKRIFHKDTTLNILVLDHGWV